MRWGGLACKGKESNVFVESRSGGGLGTVSEGVVELVQGIVRRI
jgi:hypothetical protein